MPAPISEQDFSFIIGYLADQGLLRPGPTMRQNDVEQALHTLIDQVTDGTRNRFDPRLKRILEILGQAAMGRPSSTVAATRYASPAPAAAPRVTLARQWQENASAEAVAVTIDFMFANRPVLQGFPYTAELSEIREMLDEKKPPSGNTSYYKTFVALGRTVEMAGIQAGTPLPMTMGDALTVYEMLAAAERKTNPSAFPDTIELKPWHYDSSIDASLMGAMGYSSIATHMREDGRNPPPEWRDHWAKNKGGILRAMGEASGDELAVVLGAGHGFDLPLAELAARFRKVALYDVDLPSLVHARNAVGDATLRSKIELRPRELSGVSFEFARRVDAILAQEDNLQKVLARINRLVEAYHLSEPILFLESGEKADFLVSTMLVSQLAYFPVVYFQKRFLEKFPESEELLSTHMGPFVSRFSMQLQQQHINGLGTQADRIIVTSDFAMMPITQGAQGIVPTGPRISSLGTQFLPARIPASYVVADKREWAWVKNPPRLVGSQGDMDGIQQLTLVKAVPSETEGSLPREGSGGVPPSATSGTAQLSPRVGTLALAWKENLIEDEMILLELLKGDESHIETLAEEGRKLTEEEGESADPIDEEILILIDLCNRATNQGYQLDAEEIVERMYGEIGTTPSRNRTHTVRTSAPTLAKMPVARAGL